MNEDQVAVLGHVSFVCAGERAHIFPRDVASVGDELRFVESDADRCPKCGHVSAPLGGLIRKEETDGVG